MIGTLRRQFGPVALALLLASCAGAPKPSSVSVPEIGPRALAALPKAQTGDRWKYDRGSSTRVIAYEDAALTLKRGRSTEIIKPVNPFLPAMRYESRKFQIVSEITAPGGFLFPLQPGKEDSFTEKRWSLNKQTGRERFRERQWNCRVEEMETVLVPAGRFDTYPVICDIPASDAFFRIARSYRWNYAPAIGQIVQERYERFRKAPRTKKLVSISSAAPLARGKAFENALQQTFETKRSGEAAAWNDSQSGQSGMITVERTFKDEAGTYCREALVQLATAETPIGQNLVACRGEDGRWIPKLP